MPCNRNVLIGEKMAHSIVSDCGRRGKCVNGKCVIDSKFFYFFTDLIVYLFKMCRNFVWRKRQ